MNLKQSLIENNSILLNQSAANWEDAIKIGTDLLVKPVRLNHAITIIL